MSEDKRVVIQVASEGCRGRVEYAVDRYMEATDDWTTVDKYQAHFFADEETAMAYVKSMNLRTFICLETL